MSSSPASPIRSPLTLQARTIAFIAHTARRAYSKARPAEETIGSLVLPTRITATPIGPWSACWAHNPKVLGSSPSPRIVDYISQLDYSSTTSRLFQSTTMAITSQHSRSQSATQVLTTGQAPVNTTHTTSLITKPLRSVVIRDHTITLPPQQPAHVTHPTALSRAYKRLLIPTSMRKKQALQRTRS